MDMSYSVCTSFLVIGKSGWRRGAIVGTVLRTLPITTICVSFTYFHSVLVRMTSSRGGIFGPVCVEVFYMPGAIVLVTEFLLAKRMSVWIRFICPEVRLLTSWGRGRIDS
jgi:hypothetical protein